jgi:UDP-N-acetylmuramate dehydrogenase
MKQAGPEYLKAAMLEKRNDRESKGHYRSPCAGSAFKNNRDFGAPSGVLIDRCGLKGFRIGGAAVSPWHGNIIINDRGASARDVRDLLKEVGRRVEESTGFRMELEILTIGDWRS